MNLENSDDISFHSFLGMNDRCFIEGFLGILGSTYHLSLGIVWVLELADAARNPMVTSSRSRGFYLLMATGLSSLISLGISILPDDYFERVNNVC